MNISMKRIKAFFLDVFRNFRSKFIFMTALVLIDVQRGLQEIAFYGTERNNPEAEENCGRLLNYFRKNQLPVFHVKHNSTNLSSPLHPSKLGNDFHSAVQPMINETIFEKAVNSAFIGTNLEASLFPHRSEWLQTWVSMLFWFLMQLPHLIKWGMMEINTRPKLYFMQNWRTYKTNLHPSRIQKPC